MYELRYVAFIDLLGFKGKVYNSISDGNEYDKLQRVLNYIYNLKIEGEKDPYSLKQIGKEFSMFSDSIVISYPANGYGNAFNILLDIAHICLDILNFGYIFRGGIAMDYLYHKDAVCFGPAMNIAVDMEKQAKFPRIIIARNVLENAMRYPGKANNSQMEADHLRYLVKFDDNKFFNEKYNPEWILNYLSLFEEMDNEYVFTIFLSKTRELINKEYHKAGCIPDYCKRKNIQDKYIWFANYFNDIVSGILRDYSNYIINL